MASWSEKIIGLFSRKKAGQPVLEPDATPGQAAPLTSIFAPLPSSLPPLVEEPAARSPLPPAATDEAGPVEPAAPPEVRHPVVQVRPIGQVANRMIQHMVALSIAERVPGTRISRVHLPEWGMDEPDLLELPAPIEVVNGNRFAIEEVAARLRSGETGTAEIRGYVQNINNFLPVDVYRNYFVSTADVEGFGPDELLISLRTAEVLSANFPPYVLLPISFYREMIDQTGLKPVFFGQLSDSPYLDSLRAAFPEARFVHGAGIIHDFEKIRRSRNILLSVSTFAWCAAWMSHADRIIMPLTGLFNPVFAEFRCGGIDLIPKTDPRYEFYLFRSMSPCRKKN